MNRDRMTPAVANNAAGVLDRLSALADDWESRRGGDKAALGARIYASDCIAELQHELATLRAEAAESKLAAQAAEIAEFRQQKSDWMADASIAADDKAQRRAITELYNQAERAKEEACGVLRKISKWLPGSLANACLSDEVAAFLAAHGARSGGENG